MHARRKNLEKAKKIDRKLRTDYWPMMDKIIIVRYLDPFSGIMFCGNEQRMKSLAKAMVDLHNNLAEDIDWSKAWRLS